MRFLFLRTAAQPAERPPDRVEVLIVHPLFERDDAIVSDLYVLRTHFGAALGDVAVTDAGAALQQRPAVERVPGMHLETGDPDHEAGSVERRLRLMVAEDVAHVLAQEALDALAELDAAVDVFLLHAPGFARRKVLLARRERRDLLVDL